MTCQRHDYPVQTTMAQWFAYGEDILTYWALRERLDVILTQLGDESDPNSATVFYRPSFGRRASYDRASPRAEFGEFDAIVATSRAIYPIEAKWYASQEVDGTTITVNKEQVIRHKVFAWYFKQYVDCEVSWEHFVEKYDSTFRAVFPGKKLAPRGSKLADNIQFVLRKLNSFDSAITDVLLYLHPQDSPATITVDPTSFAPVSVPFCPESKHGIFRL